MAYKIELSPETLKRLWMLRKYCAEGPIIQQVREAVGQYLKQKETEIGTSIEDVAEAIDRHKHEQENG